MGTVPYQELEMKNSENESEEKILICENFHTITNYRFKAKKINLSDFFSILLDGNGAILICETRIFYSHHTQINRRVECYKSELMFCLIMFRCGLQQIVLNSADNLTQKYLRNY